ncbi:MAG: diacylglycerol kinase family protein [Candidatus Dojkabacteria bacterium]|nr:diacylglycerol kinase family protein [Candidatus Dojkabacteria bacterium]
MPAEACSCPEQICVQGDGGSNSKNHRFDAKNYWESQRYAFQGLRLILKNERNFRIQVLSAFAVIAAGLLFGISHRDWVTLFVVMAIVLVSEAFNSVIEAICDTISKDYRITIQYAKDVSAGAVMVSAIVSLIAGVIIFSPYVWEMVINLV